MRDIKTRHLVRSRCRNHIYIDTYDTYDVYVLLTISRLAGTRTERITGSVARAAFVQPINVQH